MKFYFKIKISEKSNKNYFLNENNLLLLVIIFAIIIKIKNSIKICWKIKIGQTIGNLNETPMVISLKWPLATTYQRTGRAGPPGSGRPYGSASPCRWPLELPFGQESRDRCLFSPLSGFHSINIGVAGRSPSPLSHSLIFTHSLALKFLSSIFQQVLVQESSAKISTSS